MKKVLSLCLKYLSLFTVMGSIYYLIEIIWRGYSHVSMFILAGVYALLGIVASLAPVIFGYYSKSKAENTEGGIVYETAMKEHETTNSESGKG